MKIRFVLFGWIAAPIQSSTTTNNPNLQNDHATTTTTTTLGIQTHTILSNGHPLPLLGTGVGNLQHERIVPQISAAIGRLGTNLIDTAQASHNEDLVVLGIQKGVEEQQQQLLRSKSDDGMRITTEKDGNVRSRKGTGISTDTGGSIVIDVVTKVWYTHLGYERTTRAVRDTVHNLQHQMQRTSTTGGIDLKLHVLIHWPRCRHDIPWMRCEEEENELPEDIQRLGFPPHRNPDTAFIDSWRALQDLYGAEQHKGVSTGDGTATTTTTVTIASIGVSNFDLNDLEQLQAAATTTIVPHILQANVWSYLFDPYLVHYCRSNSIHIQLYNVMNGIISPNSFHRAPRSAEVLRSIASSLSATPAQTVVRYLLTQGSDQVINDDERNVEELRNHQLSLIPRTTSTVHLTENSLRSLSSFPALTRSQTNTVRVAVRGLLEGRDYPDLPPASSASSSSSSAAAAVRTTKPEESPSRVRFVNGMVEEIMRLFWLDARTGEEKMVAEVGAGEEVVQRTWPGHIFVAYVGDGSSSGSDKEERRKEFLVEHRGEEVLQDFRVEF